MIIATAGGFFRHLDAGKWADIGQATIDTLLMLLGSLPLTLAIGLPLGVLLYLFGAPQMKRRPFAYGVLALVVNLLRSVPFIILMIVLIPVTLFLMGTSLGVRGAIVPLVIGAAPFYARLVETALREVDRGVIEATQAMGATTWQLVTRVLLPEARPGLIAGATVTTVALIGFTAMGGAIGSGGLGDLAFRDGYQRSHTDVALVTVVLLLILVQLLQMLGDRLVAHYRRKYQMAGRQPASGRLYPMAGKKTVVPAAGRQFQVRSTRVRYFVAQLADLFRMLRHALELVGVHAVLVAQALGQLLVQGFVHVRPAREDPGHFAARITDQCP